MKIVKDFIVRDIAGETLLIPTGDTSREFNGFMGLSETGRFIWEELSKEPTLEELVARITEEYEIDEETARQDAIEFVSKLMRVGIVKV